jgi:hypothetical protein
MSKCAVIDLQTNQQVNFILAYPTDPAPEGTKLVEIPDGYYWSDLAGQVLVDTQYWDGTQVQTIPDGYYWDGTQLQLIGND